jgi:hypothetical protein
MMPFYTKEKTSATNTAAEVSFVLHNCLRSAPGLLALPYPAEHVHRFVIDSLQIDRLSGGFQIFHDLAHHQSPGLLSRGYRFPGLPLVESVHHIVLPAP